MKNVNILYSSDQIHSAIKKLFSEPGTQDRRVALVAYVGGDGESYLPHSESLRLICSPSPGGTDPDTLRRMLKRGANVEFSDKLHMKVYWSRDRGCIITSANASSSALGVSGLKEAGVYLPPGLVDIDKLIRYASPRDVSQSDLHKLDQRVRAYKRNVGNKGQQKGKAPDFLDWYTSLHRSKWKIAWFGEEVNGTAKAAKEMTYSEYGLKEPYTWGSISKGRVRKTDWLLSFFLTNRGIKSVKWIYVDFIVKISPREERYYFRDWPYHAVQVHTPSRYPLPPFRITAQFRKGLHHAIKRYSHERLMQTKSNLPPVRLLNFISEEIKSR
jgi:hypothetical protein